MFHTPLPLWMGIINLSPDSFSDGEPFYSTQKTTEKCLNFVQQGAHIIDFGGVATNPKTSQTISAEEELHRIYNHIKEARKALPKNILISVDTFSPKVAYTLAKENLIDIINDIYAAQKYETISNLDIKNTAHIAAEFNLGLILMHMPTEQPQGKNCVQNIKNFLGERIAYCKQIGVTHIAIDPGIGYGRFGKSFQNILEILKKESIAELCTLGAPLLIGVSRKSFHLEIDPTLVAPKSRDTLSKEIELKCIEYGAQIIRTHVIKKE
ncbi:MAG: dihydropteroate synthase [Bdellovibrionota bacterium]